MNTKQMVMIGTIAAAITLGGSTFVDKVSSRPQNQSNTYKINTPSRAALDTVPRKDVLLENLGAASDEEVHTALYNGKPLADIASTYNKDVQAVIDLQLAEMTAQLNERLASGSISPAQHQAHMAELAEIITKSAYGQA